MRRRVERLARSIQTYTTPRALITSAATLSLILTTYQFYKSFLAPKSSSDFVSDEDYIQSDKKDIGVQPKAMPKERENVWYKNEYQLSELNLSRKTLSSNSMSEDQIYSLVRSNVAHLRVWTGTNKGVDSVIFCLKGQYYTTNNHNIPTNIENLDMDLTYQSRKDGITNNIRIKINQKDIIRNYKKDLCYFKIKNLPPKKGVFEFLPLEPLEIRCKGFLVTRYRDGSIMKNVLNAITPLDHKVNLPEFNNALYKGIPGVPTKVGDCGSPMLVKTPLGYSLIGMHLLGDEEGIVSASSMILKSDFNIDDTIIDSEPKLSSESKEMVLGDLHKKSTFRYIESGSASVYGSFIGFRNTPKSRVENTPMSYFLSNKGYKIKFGKPCMGSWEPWRIAALDMVEPVTNIDTNILEICKKSFINDIMQNLPKEQLDLIEIYNDFTSINGAPGISYVDKINRNTSAGNPWKKSKKYFMESIPEQYGCQHPVKVDNEIMDRVNGIIDTYSQGKRVRPNFCAHLKDEPVSHKKVKLKKTRVFTGAPFDWTIVVRKFLLSSIRVIQNNRYIFEAAPGTVAQSYEWHEMYNYITKFGDNRIVAGDYKSFDKKMSPLFILAAFDILKSLCSASGNYDDISLRIIDGIAIDTAFPFVDFNGDLVEFYGSNPSGHPLTVIINSLVNSLYMRYVYYDMNPEKEVKSFKENVSLMTYGDDNIMSVNETVCWYNHSSIADAFAKMGIVYTMADKEAKSIPYVNISETSFLKRSWRYDSEVKAMMAQLDHESIEKMLMVWVKSKSISQEEQIIEVVTTAMMEYFYYGRKIYNEKMIILKELIIQLDLEDWILPKTFQSFDKLKESFWKNSERVGCLPSDI